MHGLVRPVGHFLRHLVEMCMVMCIGLAILDLLFFAATRAAGYPQPLTQLPELSVLVVAVNMTVPMVIWMRLRAMAWAPVWEMSAAMFAEALVVLAAFWLGLVAAGQPLFGLQHALMLPAMLIPMLLRFDLYSGRTGYRAAAGAPESRQAVR